MSQRYQNVLPVEWSAAGVCSAISVGGAAEIGRMGFENMIAIMRTNSNRAAERSSGPVLQCRLPFAAKVSLLLADRVCARRHRCSKQRQGRND